MTNEEYYILGYLWADAYFEKKYHYIKLEISSTDAYEIFKYFDKKWVIRDRKNDNRTDCKRNPLSTIYSSNRTTINFLKNLGYLSRIDGMEKVIQIIPYEKMKYFIRGYSDGDGCFYFNPKRSTRQFVICERYDMNWKPIIEFFQKIGIKFIQKRKIDIKRGHKSSIIRITNKKEIIKFINYIYDDYKQYPIGLKRKYSKAMEMISFIKTKI